jgi:hypothetical protein
VWLRRADPVLKFILLVFLIAYTVGFGLAWFLRPSSDLMGQYLPRIAIAALLVTGREGAGGLLRKLNPSGQWVWVPVLRAALRMRCCSLYLPGAAKNRGGADGCYRAC